MMAGNRLLYNMYNISINIIIHTIFFVKIKYSSKDSEFYETSRNDKIEKSIFLRFLTNFLSPEFR